MIFSDNGKAFLVSLEGVSLTPYLDSVNVKTVGVGSTVSDIPDIALWPWDKTLTLQEVFYFMNKGLHKYINAVDKAVKVPLNQHQFDALVSICYNIGVGGLSGSTFIKRINNGASLNSVVDAIMFWKKPKEIIGRRTKEAKLYVAGNYGNGKASVFPVSTTTHKPLYRQGKTINAFDYINKDE